ncbi:hypothetical protein PMZ80_002244 [Knufia obscura]|uniref:Purine-cytosine permease n=2 Tax=Knufia TaxID=430999 RepID=A0AAN8EAH4_9EURO|nr:hypothetical protein PMZ80_002244 [Knufia obscura]KAK5950604.1 hypothetical protein OHC33_008270 [Knufia fluminis]
MSSPLRSSSDEYGHREKDVENNKAGIYVNEQPTGYHGNVTPTQGIIRARQIQSSVAPFRWLSQGEQWLDRKMGIETQGIDRIPEDQKRPPSIWNVFLMWWGATCHIGTVPIGALGPTFGLPLNKSVAAIVVGTWLGALCPAFCGTLGPKLGMRSIATSRYAFGFYGAKLCSVLSIVVAGGFGVVNIVITGQLLSAVSDYTMSVSVGCIIVTVISYLVSVFGFRYVHTFLKYCWIISFILLLVLVGQAAPHAQAGLPGFSTGLAHAGTWLSMFSIAFSSTAGWASFSADYYCNYPAKTPSWKIFFLTQFGATTPIMFATIVGAVIANAAMLGQVEPWYSTYGQYGLGGLIRETYSPLGWSKFCLVMLTFSVLGNNVLIFYSSGLDLQLLGDYFHAVPRFIWSFLTAVALAALSIAGKQHLSTIISNFVSMLGYWAICFTLILLIEDQLFRRKTGYDLEAWDTPSKLPWGFAAIFSLLAGYLGGGLQGMSQVWYMGEVAQKFGPGGGDVGIYLTAAITLVVYPVTRYLERRFTGR